VVVFTHLSPPGARIDEETILSTHEALGSKIGSRVCIIAPALVQNRCYARDGWDREVRAWCEAHGARYQGFSLLTANRNELARPAVHEIALRRGASVPEIVFAFARQVGMIVLTGTTDPVHMRADLAAASLVLDEPELRTLLDG
jgi:diketogulonate reductase-like aldo/keto reductase